MKVLSLRVPGYALAVGVVLTGTAASAQPAPRPLAGTPTELDAEFSAVVGIREMRDGRAIVADRGEKSVKLVDFARGTATVIGRNGAGPGEYALPTALLALPGDTTAVVDNPNARLLLLDGTGAPVGTWSAPPTSGMRLPAAVDPTGRFYFALRPGLQQAGGRVIQDDTAALVRLDRTTSVLDTIAGIGIQKADIRVQGNIAAGPTGGGSVSIVRGPFGFQDAWAPVRDGGVVIARVSPYRVEVMGANGRHVAGPVIAAERVKVTDADRREFDSRAGSPRSGGGASPLGAAGSPPPSAHVPWPEHKPPFQNSSAAVDAQGRLWLRRYLEAGAKHSLYDVFDGAGLLVQRIQLPATSRVVGFGAAAVYVVRQDEDGLEFLQRWPMPRP